MPVVSLPPTIDPFKWADRATQVVADVPLVQFTRLAADLVHTNGSVQVNCRFERDAQKMAFLRGDVATTVALTCQRCLETMELPLQVTIDLALVYDEDHAKKLPEDADYLVKVSSKLHYTLTNFDSDDYEVNELGNVIVDPDLEDIVEPDLFKDDEEE